MPMPSRVDVLLTQQGVDNTAFTTAAIDTREYESITYFVLISGGVAPAGLNAIMSFFGPDGVTSIGSQGATISTGAAGYGGGIGPGCTGSSNIPNGGFAQTVPPFLKITVPAFGLGITAKLTVWGRRNFRGPSSPINAE